MKNLLKMGVIVVLFQVIACKHDKEATNILGEQDCVYSLDYDAEVTATTKPTSMVDMGRLTLQDRVDLMPQTSRNAVRFCMKKNGSSDWLIEKKQPQHVFEAKSYTLPDPSPKTKFIHIRDDKAVFIDEQGKMIRETAFELNQFSVGLKEMIKIARNTNATGNFDKMLSDARKDGAVVKDLGDGIYTLTKNVTKANENITITVTVDKMMGRIVGNAIYDSTGKPKHIALYSYDNSTKPVIKNVIQRSYKTTRNGISLVTEKTTQFHKLEINGTLPTDDEPNSKLD